MKIYRGIINSIDSTIFNLLRLRFSIGLRLEIKKRKLGLPIRINEIEKMKLNKIKKISLDKKLNQLFFEQLFKNIINESVRLQEEQRRKSVD